MNTVAKGLIALSVAPLLAACGDFCDVARAGSRRSEPAASRAHKTFIPTVDIAFARSWPEGAKPTPAPDLSVSALATGLVHPRWLYVLPNGDVLVAETNAPEGRRMDGVSKGSCT